MPLNNVVSQWTLREMVGCSGMLLKRFLKTCTFRPASPSSHPPPSTSTPPVEAGDEGQAAVIDVDSSDRSSGDVDGGELCRWTGRAGRARLGESRSGSSRRPRGPGRAKAGPGVEAGAGAVVGGSAPACPAIRR